MQNPYYEMTVPLFTKALHSVDRLLTKAEAYVQEKGLPESDILEARLAPDMFPFIKQVRMVSDNAKGASSRMAGVVPPSFEDTEVTFADLHARVAKTLEFLKTLSPEQFEGAGDRKVELAYFKDKHFIGHDYLMHYGLPNFYFHFTTVYAILRMKGLTIGKTDYIGMLPLKDNTLT